MRLKLTKYLARNNKRLYYIQITNYIIAYYTNIIKMIILRCTYINFTKINNSLSLNVIVEDMFELNFSVKSRKIVEDVECG